MANVENVQHNKTVRWGHLLAVVTLHLAAVGIIVWLSLAYANVI